MAEHTGSNGAPLEVFVVAGGSRKALAAGAATADSPMRVVAVGEVDASSARRLSRVLANLSGCVELDCSGLRFVDASFLRAVTTAHQNLSAKGGSLLVTRPSEPVRYLLDLFGLDLASGNPDCSCGGSNGECSCHDARPCDHHRELPTHG